MTNSHVSFFALGLIAAGCAHDAPPPAQAAPPPMAARAREAVVDPVREARIPVSPEADQVNPVAVPTAPAAAIAASEALDDEKVLRIAHVANEGEIDAAKLAVTHARDARVRELARMIVRDHTEADERGERVARTAKLTPKESDLSTKLQSEAHQTVDALAAKTGADFDRAYLAAQVAAHRDVLQLIDVHLIPGATSAPVKNLVRSIRPGIAKHYEEAQALQAKIDK